MIRIYYSNIQNKELAYFHNRPVHNFTAKLTDVLTSDLFKVEEIITDSIYKIYPLFYTNEITSSNSNDRILDNKVIICQKLEDETYLTFKSNDGEIIDFTDYGTYYDIGDSLTMAQFNAYISLLRQNITHSDEIHIKDTVNGVYGNYIFDINNATLIDTGLVITDETIQAQPKVKLTDNVFSNSNYILKLDVIHYTGANILDDTTSDYKVVDTLEIELIADEWVNIPVTELQQDYIISLNATVDIDHKKPVIYIPDYELTLTSDKDIIQTDETANLTATLTLEGEPLTGETITFKVYKASDQSLVETLTGTTNSQGIATVSYVGEGTGVLNIQCEAPERMISSEIYEVMDCILYDEGTSARHNDAMYDLSNTNLDFSRETEYTLISEKNTSSNTFITISNLPQSCIVDFELAYVDGSMGNGFMNLNNGNTYKQFFSIQNLGYPTTLVTDFFRLRLTYGNGSVTLTDLDNPTKTVTKTYTEYIDKIYFITSGEIHSLKIRNVKVYNP